MVSSLRPSGPSSSSLSSSPSSSTSANATSATPKETSSSSSGTGRGVEVAVVASTIASTLVAAVGQGLEPPTGQALQRLLGQNPISAPRASTSLPTTHMAKLAEIALRGGQVTFSPQQAVAVDPALKALADIEPDALRTPGPSQDLVLAGLSTLEREILQTALEGGNVRVVGPLTIALRDALRTGRPDLVTQTLRTRVAALMPASSLPQLPVVATLSPRHQQVVQSLGALDGDHHVTGLRASVTGLLLSADFATMAPDARDEALTALLGQRGSYDSGVRGYRGVAVAVAADIAAGACTAEQGRADFNLVAAGTADVTGHDGVVGCDVTLVFDDGQRLAVTTPTTSPPGTPDTATLGRALARIDPALRGLARRLVINPVENPHDVVVRQTPGFSPTHRSAATALAGADVIHLYPGAVDAALDAATDGAAETWLVALLTHELAHLLQARVERAPDLAAQWRQAVRDDVVRASAYAFSTDGEDFAEAVALHLTSRGTPTHDALRGLMPGRFAAIDAILQALPSLSAPSSSSSTSSSSSSSGPNS